MALSRAATGTIKPLRKAERIMVVSDNHGELADIGACRTALEFARYFKPTIRVHAGDCWDFRWLRRSANEDERRAGSGDDIGSGLDFIKQYRPTHFLQGNHEVRIFDAMESTNARVSELATLLWGQIAAHLDGVIQFPYCKRKGVLRIADYSFVHGFRAGMYAVKQTGAAYGKVVMGHLHRPTKEPIERHEDTYAYCCGCLCLLDMSYNRAQQGTLAQKHGFMYGWIVNNRIRWVQAECTDGLWTFPTEMMTYGR